MTAYRTIDVGGGEVFFREAGDPSAATLLLLHGFPSGSEDAFLAYSDRLKHFRQRTGGMYWRLFVDEAITGRYLETYLVESWEEHERQHTRETRHDEQLLEDIGKLLVPGTKREPHHYLTAPIPH